MKKQNLSPIEAVFGIAIEEAKQRFDELTDREREVAELMATGEKNTKIAKQLGISPKTLDIHRTNAKRKLKARGSVDVARVVFATKASM
jgi:DNA-binding NarL/FixJ family response regulator